MAVNSISDANEWLAKHRGQLITDGKCKIVFTRQRCEEHQRSIITKLCDGTINYRMRLCQGCKYQLTDKDETPATNGHRRLGGLTKYGLARAIHRSARKCLEK